MSRHRAIVFEISDATRIRVATCRSAGLDQGHGGSAVVSRAVPHGAPCVCPRRLAISIRDAAVPVCRIVLRHAATLEQSIDDRRWCSAAMECASRCSSDWYSYLPDCQANSQAYDWL